METLLGTSLAVFVGLTLALFGLAAFLTGQALANAWRPIWHVIPCGLVLAAANRFLTFALFDGELLSISGYVVDSVVLLFICALTYRLTLAQRMISQYPWLYQREGLFGWRALDGS
jgi:hypothetical protein